MKAKNLILIVALFFLFVYGKAQESVSNAIEQKFNKHEIGISWGAFPTSRVSYGIAFWQPASTYVNVRHPGLLSNVYPYFAHTASRTWKGPNGDDEYYTMQHYGALTINYQYHFTKKHSLGFATTWLGRYVTNYTARAKFEETIDAKGWDNVFSFYSNYRFSYFSKENLSIYTGICIGLAVNVIQRKLLLSTEKNAYYVLAFQATGFGIEAGKKHCYVGELGFGSQGVIKMGYKYKF
ncbi:MAG: hypothetical protein GX330_04985 [Bacteroidales bacterium]|nr:hypothetical protein [Bacteroidales bacterium]